MNFLELLEKCTENVTFFEDETEPHIFYAEYLNHYGKNEFSRIDSFVFRSYLAVESAEVTNNSQILDVKRAIEYLQYALSAYGECEKVSSHIRIAGNLKDSIEYDLQDSSSKSVVVTGNGWSIENKKSKFIVPENSLPQVTPKRTSESPLETLKPFTNLQGNDFTMFVIWLIQAFSCDMHHALLVMADKGSGKTVLSKFVKLLTDPFKFHITAIPDKNSDLIVLLYNTWLCCLDNVSNISGDTSDILCGAISGTASVKRSLFTDTELSIAKLHSTLVINGIKLVPGKDDLAERMLIITPPKLTKNIQQESILWKNFEVQRPYILGSIFNTLSKAINEIKTLNISWLPRMSDSYVEMMAIAKALGINENEFCRLYKENVEKMNALRYGTPLVQAIDEYAKKIPKRKVEQSADELLKELLNSYSGDISLLPSSSSNLSRKLTEEYNNIFDAGYRINIDDSGYKNTQISIIKKK